MFKNNNTVGHGYFRKSKAYGLVCGIALATAFLGSHVSADETVATQESTVAQSEVVTTADTTTATTGDEVVENPVETPTDDVKESTDEVVETPKEETNLQLPEATTPEQEKINQTVEDTKDILDNAGVKVEIKGENHYTDSNEAQADADKQKVETEKFAEAQKAIDEAIKQAQELANKAGLTVTVKPTTVTSIDEAKAKLAEVQKLIEDATNKLIADNKAETEANKLIEEAKKKAEEAGVIITTTEKQNYDKADDALADAESQKQKLEEIINAQNSVNKQLQDLMASLNAVTETITGNKVTVSSIEEANKKLAEIKAKIQEIDKKNAELKAKYDAEVKEVTEYNQAQKETYDKAYAQYVKDLEAYNKKLAEVQKHNEEVKKQEEVLKKDNIASDEKNGIYVTGQFNKGQTGLDFYKDITIVSTNKDAVGATSLGWQVNTTISNANGLTVTPHDTANDPMIHGTTSNFLYKVTEATVGDSFMLNNIGKTSDGRNINALVTIAKASTLTNKELSWFLIGYTADKGVAVDYWNFDSLGLTFKFLDDNGKELRLIVGSVIGDVDNGQGSKVEFDGNVLHRVNPDGSGLIQNADGSLVGNNSGVDGYQQAPIGTYLMVGSSTTLHYTHTSDGGVIDGNGNIRNYIEFDLFGTASMVNTITVIPEPEKPDEVKEPTYKELPQEPDYQKADVPTIQIATTVHEVGVNKTTEMEVETPQLETEMHTVVYDKPAEPEVVKASVLPSTGDETSTASVLASVAGAVMALVGLVGMRKRKEG